MTDHYRAWSSLALDVSTSLNCILVSFQLSTCGDNTSHNLENIDKIQWYSYRQWVNKTIMDNVCNAKEKLCSTSSEKSLIRHSATNTMKEEKFSCIPERVPWRWWLKIPCIIIGSNAFKKIRSTVFNARPCFWNKVVRAHGTWCNFVVMKTTD